MKNEPSSFQRTEVYSDERRDPPAPPPRRRPGASGPSRPLVERPVPPGSPSRSSGPRFCRCCRDGCRGQRPFHTSERFIIDASEKRK